MGTYNVLNNSRIQRSKYMESLKANDLFSYYKAKFIESPMNFIDFFPEFTSQIKWILQGNSYFELIYQYLSKYNQS